MREGYLEGAWSKRAAVEAPAAFVFDVTAEPVRIRGSRAPVGVRFQAEPGRSYLLVGEAGVLRPEVRPARREWLKRPRAADYLVIGPRAFFDAARPLVELRRGQGLDAIVVPLEDVYAEFGFGEARPEAIRDFIRYAYHEWRSPPGTCFSSATRATTSRAISRPERRISFRLGW
jgi:hypothetical protein